MIKNQHDSKWIKDKPPVRTGVYIAKIGGRPRFVTFDSSDGSWITDTETELVRMPTWRYMCVMEKFALGKHPNTYSFIESFCTTLTKVEHLSILVMAYSTRKDLTRYDMAKLIGVDNRAIGIALRFLTKRSVIIEGADGKLNGTPRKNLIMKFVSSDSYNAEWFVINHLNLLIAYQVKYADLKLED